MPEQNRTTYSGYIAILGQPNAGKSTLLNALIGTKVSIVSPKVQTTRTRILGVLTEPPYQAVLIDTPGLFVTEKRLGKAMVSSAWKGAYEADIILFLHDVSRHINALDKELIKQLQTYKKPVWLVLNKIDLKPRDVLLSQTKAFMELYPFLQVFMISSLKQDGINDLKAHIFKALPQGPWFYDESELSNLSERLWAAEVTREKLFLKLHQELPYHLAVETEDWQVKENGHIHIYQQIITDEERHKQIILGKKGQMIKQIGQASRLELESQLETKVSLFLHVKYQKKWQENPAFYHMWGLH